MGITEAVLDVNERQPGRIVEIVERGLGDISGRQVTVLGLAFKPDTDDVRESPAFPIIDQLLAHGAVVRVHDPIATESARTVLGDRVVYELALENAVRGADAIVLVTPWAEYARLPRLLESVADPPLVVDCRRWLSASSVRRYEGVGRRMATVRASGS
jgi:UDPglucose 6-dehydrogenase/GDP-mannose 6-dehydrogenase